MVILQCYGDTKAQEGQVGKGGMGIHPTRFVAGTVLHDATPTGVGFETLF